LEGLTCACNLENIVDIVTFPNYTFEKGAITNIPFVENLFSKYDFDGVIHLAAE